MIIFSKKIDFIFIKFPVIFPIIYLCTLYAMPQYGMVIAFLALITLAEPHFGATWSIFLDKNMRTYAKNNKFLFIYSPILIAIGTAILFFKFANLFYLLFFAFNIYHVTRQSIGICKLFSSTKTEILYQEYFLYLINFIIFFGVVAIHLMNLITAKDATLFGICVLVASVFVTVIQTIKFKSWETSLTTFSGLSIFIPAFFVSEPIHAILAGVTMHYSQYLMMMLKINLAKSKQRNDETREWYQIINVKNYVLLIFLYGVIAVLLTTLSSSGTEAFSNLIFIPLLGQVLHFYLDGFIWKFKNDEMKDVHLKFLLYNLDQKQA